MENATASDRDLILAAVGGDREALETLVSRHRGLVRTACARQVVPAEVDDCMQGVFLVLMRKPDQAARAPALEAWLLTVTRYVCLCSRRSLKRRRRAEQEAALQTRNDVSPRSIADPAAEHLDACLARLPERQRAVLILHFLSGRDRDEVARLLGIGLDAVHQNCHRGLERLRELLRGRGVAIPLAGLVALLSAEAKGAAAVASAGLTNLMPSASNIQATAYAKGAIATMTVSAFLPASLLAVALVAAIASGAAAFSGAGSGDHPAGNPKPAANEAKWPAWRKALIANQIRNISAPGDTVAVPYKAAGYYVPGWEGDVSTNLTAWAGGVLAEKLGPWGSLLCGANGHELQPSSTIHRFDLSLDQPKWVEPICPPQIHRQVAPDFQAPPKGAECWWSEDPKIPVMSWQEVEAKNYTVDHPFRVGAYAFPYWPSKYGLQYAENVTAGMRYDCYSIQPEECGGEPAGTMIFHVPGAAHEYNITGSWNMFTWRYGLTSRKWLPRSLDPGTVGGISQVTAFSEKYRKVFSGHYNKDEIGVYDPKENKHTVLNTDSQPGAYVAEGTAVITEGFSSHLFIATGRARGTNEPCLFLVDLDDAQSNPRNWPVAVMNSGSAGNASPRRWALLTPNVSFTMGVSLAWARNRRALILWQSPPARASNETIPTAQPQDWTLYVIIIPEQWKTEPWKVFPQKLTLAPGVTGISAGVVGQGYKRFAWSNALDCAIWNGAPEASPVQAFCLDWKAINGK